MSKLLLFLTSVALSITTVKAVVETGQGAPFLFALMAFVLALTANLEG